MDNEVIIVDGSGREHVFPSGFDPKKAAEIVRAQSAPAQSSSATPAEKPDPLARIRRTAGGLPAGELWQRVKDNPVQTGAMVGSMIGTGGLGPLAAIARAALGAAGGAGYGIAADAHFNNKASASWKDDAKTMAKEGALGATGEGVGRIAKAGGAKLQNAAVSAYERMLKPNKSTLEGMSGMGGNLQERSRNVASELLNDPNGQISKRGSNAYGDATSGMLNKVDELVEANPEARGSTKHLADSMDRGRGTFQKQWAPGGDTSAYDSVTKEVLNNPRVTKIKRVVKDTSLEHEMGMAPGDSEVVKSGRELMPRVTAKGARDLTRGTYRNLGDKAYGELKGAQTEAHKSAARGGRAILNEAIPEVEPINNEISKRIDLGQVLDEAVLRSGKHDPIGLGQQVVLSGGNLGFLPASLINRPGIGSPIARGVNQVGSSLQKLNLTPALKAALIAALGGQDE
jgi:hypothetical protein